MNKELLRQLEAAGYHVVPAGKHQKIKNAEGKTIFTLPTSPRGALWKVRLTTELRNRGLLQ